MIPKMKTDEDGGWNWRAEDYDTLCKKHHTSFGTTPYMLTKEWFYTIQRLENRIAALEMKN